MSTTTRTQAVPATPGLSRPRVYGDMSSTPRSPNQVHQETRRFFKRVYGLLAQAPEVDPQGRPYSVIRADEQGEQAEQGERERAQPARLGSVL